MARLALELVPEPSVPARFPRTVPVWGVPAGRMRLAAEAFATSHPPASIPLTESPHEA